MDDIPRSLLVVSLVATGALGLGYRIYRWTKKGPIGDVWGQAVLAVLLVTLAVLTAREVSAARWAAVGFGIVFGVVVMPFWILAVLIPLRPGPIDVAFTALYWALLVVVVAAGIAA